MRYLLVLLLAVVVYAQPMLYPSDFADEGMAGVLMEQGTAISELVPGGAAEKAGLLAGDVITSIAGTSVVGMSKQQALAVLRRPAGSHGAFEVLRGGSNLSFDLTWTAIPAAILEAEHTRVTRDKLKVDAWVERMEGDRLGLVLEAPVGRVIPVGTPIVLAESTFGSHASSFGLARVTRTVSHFRLEAHCEKGCCKLWDRVVVAP